MLRNAIALVEMEENGGSFGSFGSFDPIPVPPNKRLNTVSRKSIVSLPKESKVHIEPFLMMKTQFQEAKFALEEALKGQGQEQEFTQEVLPAHKGL